MTTITLGALKFTAIATPPIDLVRVHVETNGSPSFYLTPAEWHSLEAYAAEVGRQAAQLQALRACIVYALNRRGNAFDFDTWKRMVDEAMERGDVPPHAVEEAQGEALAYRNALDNVRKERDELRARLDKFNADTALSKLAGKGSRDG